MEEVPLLNSGLLYMLSYYAYLPPDFASSCIFRVIYQFMDIYVILDSVPLLGEGSLVGSLVGEACSHLSASSPPPAALLQLKGALGCVVPSQSFSLFTPASSEL